MLQKLYVAMPSFPVVGNIRNSSNEKCFIVGASWVSWKTEEATLFSVCVVTVDISWSLKVFKNWLMPKKTPDWHRKRWSDHGEHEWKKGEILWERKQIWWVEMGLQRLLVLHGAWSTNCDSSSLNSDSHITAASEDLPLKFFCLLKSGKPYVDWTVPELGGRF